MANGNSGGGQPDDISTGIGSILKSAGTGIGTFMADRLTHGRYSEYHEKHQEEAQSKLYDQLKDRASRGEAIGMEELRQWKNIGGDPSLIAELQKSALSVNKGRLDAEKALDAALQGGVIDQQTHFVMSQGLLSDDPTMQAMAMEAVRAQFGMAKAIYTAGQAQNRLTQNITSRESEGKLNRQSHENVAQENRNAAQSRLNQAEGFTARQNVYKNQEQDRRAGLAKMAKNNVIQTQINKGQIGVNQAIQTIESGGKDVHGKPIDQYDEDTGKAMLQSANDTLVGTRGVNVDRFATEGGFHVTVKDPSMTGIDYLAGQHDEVAKGVEGIVKKVTDAETSKTFGMLWRKMLKEQDPQKSQILYKEAMAGLPTDVRNQIIDQLNEAQRRIQEREQSDQAEDQANQAAAAAAMGVGDSDIKNPDVGLSGDDDSDDSDDGAN